MTFLHHTTMAVRRLAVRNHSSKGRRRYTQLSSTDLNLKSDPSLDTLAGHSSQASSGGWVIPLTLAVLGLGFSTFSTHQLMTRSNTDLPHTKK